MTVTVDAVSRSGTVPSPGETAGLMAGTDFDGMREALVAVAWRITGDRELGLDTVQDVFLAYLRAPEKFIGSASLKTYLYRMVINRCIDARRRSDRFRLIRAMLERERRTDGDAAYDVKDTVRYLLAGIKPLYRVPFILAEGDGMSYDEIAGILEVSVNTVRSRIFRCREQLRKKLHSAGYL